MASNFTSNATAFSKRLKKVGVKLNINILRSLTRSIDDIRNRAGEQFIIPSKVKIERVQRKAGGAIIPLARKGSELVALSELQPSHPSLLTNRLGRLQKLLKSKGTWQVVRKLAELKGASRHLNFKIRPQFESGRTFYSAILVLAEKGNKDIKARLDHELGRTRSRKKRPFFEPSLKIETKSVLPDIKKLAKNEFNAKL